MLAVAVAVAVAWARWMLVAAVDPDLPPGVATGVDEGANLVGGEGHITTDIVKQMLTKRCAHHYSLPCLKLDLLRLVDRLSASPDPLHLLPGVTLRSSSHNLTDDFPQDLAQALARDSSDRSLDDFLVSRLTRYLSSLTLSVHLAEPAAYLARAPGEEGRRRKTGMGGLMTAGLFSGGTLMAVGMSALAALAGKALMTALLSLMLSALAAMRGNGGGGGGGGGKTTYEIIAKPIVTHAHTHSSEVQHEVHGGHAYAYARSMEFAPVRPAGDNDTDSYVLAYRAHHPQDKQ